MYAEFEEKIRECLKKHPVLKAEEVFEHYTEEMLSEFKDKDELRQELRASFTQYKIPAVVVEEVYATCYETQRREDKSHAHRKGKRP